MVARVFLVFALTLLAHSALAAAPAQTMTPVADRPTAADFALKDIDGKLRRLSESRGKVVLVNFWATWCPPCRREMPSMQRAWTQLKSENFEMLAINVGEDEDTIFGFTFSTGVELTFPILLDRDAQVIKAWPVIALPTSFVVDPQGRIVYRAVGGREWDDPELLKKIRELLPRK
ncbi:alkyl hydroperoxide reductase [Sulfuricaulis limicola]|uniref:Alkyl hydroperoxide reductase n=2 Tax=Sulfuricaulis limicola TaxID=1620215 RepID=A0A1B4XDA1_9GAMM|nr:alkyl hydroperoxide reductase [Sulfuricaulis limicola]